MEQFISYGQSRIFCEKTGNGPAIAFCFHGYGENCYTYNQLAISLEDTHTVYAFDLPLHGRTEWNEGLTCTPAMWQEITTQCNPENKPVTLIGYSIGGRIALSLYQCYATCYNKLVLIAPDGLHTNFWYWFSTQTWMGNRVFKHTIAHPKFIFSLVTIADKTGLINKAMYKITRHYIDNTEQRQNLYSRWTVLRRFIPSLRTIQQLVTANHTQVRLLFGKYDKVILSRNGYRFIEPLHQQQAQVQVIDAGHQLLKEKYLPLIAKLVVE
ncbi:Pimeloyl-ACP methyl ester carboxylesterase [Filimonas lacunae]|uniref:Pimeloyl-ACP methyl ester carboxylesterase n=1 Tax=Filimonas lacunae TaxID=477680 RepID=A0A173MQA9_9BACT|nr:alpha/beta hydrolase [Filimonas lacunae]BAV09865.1 2-hydroxy-6-oxo-6-phenylhexa-2,4-dienoate hydrolase [Filimonas lacunae]SIS80167.1 Pimeloyl-ACP methyl ester carboxylesterase [Filimonas lacunae]